MGNVISLRDTLKTTNRALHSRTVINLVITDYNNQHSLDSLIDTVPNDTSIFLPLYKEQIFYPDQTTSPRFYEEFFKQFASASIFPTTERVLYEHCRQQKEDWLHQLDNMWHALFQCNRIMLIDYAQKEGYESSRWKTESKYFIGNEEEALHLLLRFRKLTEVNLKNPIENKQYVIPPVTNPPLTQSNQEMYTYLSELDDSLYCFSEEVIPNHIPLSPKRKRLSRLRKKKKFIKKNQAEFLDAVFDHKDISRDLNRQYKSTERSTEEFMPIRLHKGNE